MIRALSAKRGWRWSGAFLFWTLVGLAFGTQLYLTYLKLGNPVSWRFALGRALGDWYVVAVLSLPALWLARRFRIEGQQWHWRVVLHVAGSGLFSVAWMLLRAALEAVQTQPGQAPMNFLWSLQHALVERFFFNVLIYWAMVSVSHAFHFYRRSTERELRTVELEKSLAEARWQALQMQLNPHFLFNTLHAIGALMHKDVKTAERMLVRLSDLLRTVLDRAGTQEVPLRREVAFLRSYLEIEQTRFGDRLQVRLELPENTLDALVPNLLLQPLVENSLKHGLGPRARPGWVEVGARREGARLRLWVRDNGAGHPGAGPCKDGVGLSNTRARLSQLYPGAHQFEAAALEPEGFLARVEIPFRPSAPDPSGMAHHPRPTTREQPMPKVALAP